jgi:hypothetical protein
VVSDINDRELLDDNVFDTFEPTLNLEIQGRDVFRAIGLDGIRKVIVMRFMENALRLTQRMIADLDSHSTNEYKYWFLGTGYGLRLNRSDDIVEINLDLDPRTGPLLGKEQIKDNKVLGRVSVKDWVHSLVVLSKQLTDRINAANPSSKHYLASLEKRYAAVQRQVGEGRTT